jgi:hypothetical protein
MGISTPQQLTSEFEVRPITLENKISGLAVEVRTAKKLTSPAFGLST